MKKPRVNRRTFVAWAGAALASPRVLLAQPAKRVYRIATLDDAVESARNHLWRVFRKRLGEIGLVEGRDVAYDARYASGNTEQLPVLAAELVALRPDVIAVVSTPAAQATIRATSIVPIVFIGIGDPVGSGLVSNLARPNGNATGTSITSPDFAGKWLELLLEIAPGARRLAFLTDASSKSTMLAFQQIQKHGSRRNTAIQLLDGRKRAGLERAFEVIRNERIQGVIVSFSASLLEHCDEIVQFAAQYKLPLVYARREYVDVGGLLSYGTDISFAYTRGAEYVQRILQGTKPADLPVEQSSNVRMVLNLKTAGTLGIKIPESVRMRVDELIE